MSYQKYLTEGQITVFSKSWCPFCTKVINTLKNKGVNFKVYHQDLNEMSSEEFNDLKAATNQTSVPNVFVGKTHLGGNDDTQALASDKAKWDNMLAKNGF